MEFVLMGAKVKKEIISPTSMTLAAIGRRATTACSAGTDAAAPLTLMTACTSALHLLEDIDRTCVLVETQMK
jgi:hypothetical protein